MPKFWKFLNLVLPDRIVFALAVRAAYKEEK